MAGRPWLVSWQVEDRQMCHAERAWVKRLFGGYWEGYKGKRIMERRGKEREKERAERRGKEVGRRERERERENT